MTVVVAAAAAGNVSSGLTVSNVSGPGFGTINSCNSTQYALWDAPLVAVTRSYWIEFACTVGADVHMHVYLQYANA